MDYWELFQRHVEVMKGRDLAKENGQEEPLPPAEPAKQVDRTQRRLRTGNCPEDLQNPLDRIRQAAGRDKTLRFTSLWHHVYDIERLREAYRHLRPQAAPGIDGQTWRQYGQDLEANLRDLSDRLAQGSYHARPVKRSYIPKADGKQRPIGIPVLEDKIVQRATVAVLNAVYEADFVGFSYGFRPQRNAHMALDALAVAIQSRKVNWVLDADIRSFFDTLDHGWLIQFIQHRIADRRVVRHVKKWLKAGVMEQGQLMEQ
jgi:retron-type reverse transcriptase